MLGAVAGGEDEGEEVHERSGIAREGGRIFDGRIEVDEKARHSHSVGVEL
jgi:hypothetical protein